MIPLSAPCIRGNAWTYVKDCLDTEWVSSAGKYVEQFEQKLAEYVGSRHAIACVNGTSALQVALRIAGVDHGDLVIVPTVTFIAPVNAVRYLGAEPVFMDCDEHYNIDEAKVLEFLKAECRHTDNGLYERESGRRIAAIVPVHVFGNAVNMERLLSTCAPLGVPVIEDATESLGTRYISGAHSGRHTGTLGLAGCFSFNGNKIITSGGGGMIVTDDAAVAERARYLTTQAKDDEVRFLHGDVGYNFRLTNLQAALGLSQLELLPEFLEVKHQHYVEYRKGLDDVAGLRIATLPAYASNNCWMVPLQVEADRYGDNREGVMAKLAGQKIQTRPLWQLNHQQRPYSRNRAWRIDRAQVLLERTINLPCSVGLDADGRGTVIAALRK